MRKRPHSAGFLFIREVQHVEVLDLTREFRRVFFGVELLYIIRAAFPVHQRAPSRRHVIRARRDQTESRNYYSTFHTLPLGSLVLFDVCVRIADTLDFLSVFVGISISNSSSNRITSSTRSSES